MPDKGDFIFTGKLVLGSPTQRLFWLSIKYEFPLFARNPAQQGKKRFA